MQVTIVSKHFWPSLQEETFTLHPAVDHRIKQFAAAYAQVKQPRKLVGACCSVALLARRPDVLCVWVCGCVGVWVGVCCAVCCGRSSFATVARLK